MPVRPRCSPTARVVQSIRWLRLREDRYGSRGTLATRGRGWCAGRGGGAVEWLCGAAGAPGWKRGDYADLLSRVRSQLPSATYDVVRRVAGILAASHDVGSKLGGGRRVAARAA